MGACGGLVAPAPPHIHTPTLNLEGRGELGFGDALSMLFTFPGLRGFCLTDYFLNLSKYMAGADFIAR